MGRLLEEPVSNSNTTRMWVVLSWRGAKLAMVEVKVEEAITVEEADEVPLDQSPEVQLR